MENINDTYFDGYYKDIWRSIIPDELTVKEVDFMLSYFSLQPGNKILDLLCGYGRHAIALAKKGMSITAIDNLIDYINEIKQAAIKENLPIIALQADVLTYEPNGVFDLVICMGNSLNFFNADDTQRLLRNISLHLEKGGCLLINSWSIAEIAIKNFKDRSWNNIGDKKFLVESQFLFHPTRIESEHFILTADEKTETKKAIDYIFSINEMEAMLNAAGFILKEIYSIPGRKKFTVGEPRSYFVAEKS